MYYHTLFCNYVLISFSFRKEHIDFYINYSLSLYSIRSPFYTQLYTTTTSPFMSRIIRLFLHVLLQHTHFSLNLNYKQQQENNISKII